MTKPEKRLDRALETRGSSDPDMDELRGVAERLERALDVESPPAERERTLFVQGAAARRRKHGWGSLLAPALAGAALLLLGFFARAALPGNPLYPVREALQTAGLARAPVDEVERKIERAEELLSRADGAALGSPGAAERLALQTIGELEGTRDLLPVLSATDRDRLAARIAVIEARAVELLRAIPAPDASPSPSPSPDDRGRNRGPGSATTTARATTRPVPAAETPPADRARMTTAAAPVPTTTKTA
ncbi:MAG: hypothetical protein ACRDKB_03165 [Actinomycetota bacterium]